MRHPKRIVVHSAGRYADRARFAEPPKRKKGENSLPLGMTDPDYTSIDALAISGFTSAEMNVALKRNHGSHWEKIAQDTGYSLVTVRRLHGSAQNKAIRGSIPLQRKPQPGFVYFLRSDDHIKIGYAADVAARVKELQCGNPTTLTLICAIPGKPADERSLHRRFNSDRVKGEWFRRTPKLLAFIESNGRA